IPNKAITSTILPPRVVSNTELPQRNSGISSKKNILIDATTSNKSNNSVTASS
ncbi:23428_t:CDS:1, partial [Gigaspora rosea]